jgi:DNA-binding MarR family transcriptional regulator
VVRILTDEGVRARDLPRLAGVAKEAMDNMVGRLEKRGYVVVEPDPAAGRGKLVRLTPKGLRAQAAYLRRTGAIEERWRVQHGEVEVANLRASLEQLVGEPDFDPSPLWAGLQPPPGGWRASVRKPDCLPHYPLVTHRGGFPDGS